MITWSQSIDSLNLNPSDSLPPFKNECFKPLPRDPIYRVVEQMPEFKGGKEELNKFIIKNLHNPIDDSANGRVYVEFIVTKNGNLEDIKILKGLSDELNAEVLRLIKSMPKWIPGKQRGKEINCYIMIPIIFN
jgi:protein TonB